MIWDNEDPVKPGWYWIQEAGGSPNIVEVHLSTRGLFYILGEKTMYILPMRIPYKWAGPLEPPVDMPHVPDYTIETLMNIGEI